MFYTTCLKSAMRCHVSQVDGNSLLSGPTTADFRLRSSQALVMLVAAVTRGTDRIEPIWSAIRTGVWSSLLKPLASLLLSNGSILQRSHPTRMGHLAHHDAISFTFRASRP